MENWEKITRRADAGRWVLLSGGGGVRYSSFFGAKGVRVGLLGTYGLKVGWRKRKIKTCEVHPSLPHTRAVFIVVVVVLVVRWQFSLSRAREANKKKRQSSIINYYTIFLTRKRARVDGRDIWYAVCGGWIVLARSNDGWKTQTRKNCVFRFFSLANQ